MKQLLTALDAGREGFEEMRRDFAIRVYFADGGRHVQFNVVDQAELRAALSAGEGRETWTVRTWS